jgi:hypothetical protein
MDKFGIVGFLYTLNDYQAPNWFNPTTMFRERAVDYME